MKNNIQKYWEADKRTRKKLHSKLSSTKDYFICILIPTLHQIGWRYISRAELPDSWK